MFLELIPHLFIYRCLGLLGGGDVVFSSVETGKICVGKYDM